MNLFKKIAVAVLFFAILVVSTFLVITFAYEKEVKDYMIGQLNENLKTKVIVDSKNIQLSLFKDFPFASLVFKNITMLEAPISISGPDKKGNRKFLKQDTLFSVEDISLQFSIWDILGKNYVVKEITADNGRIRLREGKGGSVNWDVWKGSDDNASSSGGSAFNLERFELKRISFSYFDLKDKDDIVCHIHKGIISGDFSSKEYDLRISGDIRAGHFNIDSVSYLDDKPVKLDLNLRVDNEKDLYEFNDALVTLSDLKIQVEGKYISGKESDLIDISLKGKDMDVQSVLSLLPEKYSKDIRDFQSEGEFYGNAYIKGKIDDVNSPEVKIDFGIKKADITQLSSGISLKNVQVTGNYFASSVSSSYFLDLQSFSAILANGKIAGSIRVDNFSSPRVSASVNADLLLEDVRQLLKVDTVWNYPVETLAGSLRLNMKYQGMLGISGNYRKSDFENMSMSGDVTLLNAGMKIKNSALAFDSINGSFLLNNNSITVNSFSGNTPRSDFYLKGDLKNILAYSLFDDADVEIDAIFQSNNFDLNEFLLDQEESTRRDTVYNVHFSPRINFRLNSDIGHLSFRKFEATDIRGTFQLRDQKLIGDPISFSTMDGSVSGSGMVDGSIDSLLLVTCDASLKRLNINKLFSQFENFGQTTMTHENLKGIGTAQVQFASVWTSDLTADLNRIYVRSDLIVEKGELIRFEPMKALSKYIEVSELEVIKFSTLSNQIEIKDQKIFIPKMDINSSALDISLSGNHTFNNEIDYHIKVLMSDILFQKAKRAKKENTEFGVVEDDKSGRTSLFISMTGTVDEPIIKYDRKGAKQNLKENLADEKHTLKQILRDEFGWFKKDSVLKKKEKPKDDGKFIIKWEDDLPAGKEGGKESGKQEDDDF